MGFNIGDFLAAPAAVQGNAVVTLSVDSLIPYHDHKFRLYTGERFSDMVQSVSKNGVLVPVIVLKIDEAQIKLISEDSTKDYYQSNIGKYEILSGHNRVEAAKAAGLTEIPAVVKTELTVFETENYVYETNLLQRGFSDLSISERAAIAAHRHSSMFTKKKAEEIRAELESLERKETEGDPANGVYILKGDKSKLAAVGAEYGLSRNSIARLVRINKLIPELKQSIDLSLISIRAGTELSYIPAEAQRAVFNCHKQTISNDGQRCEAAAITVEQAERYRELFEEFKDSEEKAEAMIEGYSKGEADKPKKPKSRKVKADIIGKYFDEDETDDYVNNIIDEALQMYFDREREGGTV